MEGVPITVHTGIVFVIRSLPVTFQPSGQSAQVLGCGLPSPHAQVGNEALVGPRMPSEPGTGLGTVVAGKVVGNDDTHTPDIRRVSTVHRVSHRKALPSPPALTGGYLAAGDGQTLYRV